MWLDLPRISGIEIFTGILGNVDWYSHIHQLCDLELIPSPLWSSVSSSVKAIIIVPTAEHCLRDETRQKSLKLQV